MGHPFFQDQNKCPGWGPPSFFGKEPPLARGYPRFSNPEAEARR